MKCVMLWSHTNSSVISAALRLKEIASTKTGSNC
jgi:hypothetical protein